MGQLKENLQAILEEKQKLQADEILEGKSIFGIDGTVVDYTQGPENGTVESEKLGLINKGERINSYGEGYGSTTASTSIFTVDLKLKTRALIPSNNDNKPCTIGIGSTELSEVIGLTADKIVEGNTILDIEGIGKTGVDTSDANATNIDLVQGKTAYVNGEKIEGTLRERYGINLMSTSEIIVGEETQDITFKGKRASNDLTDFVARSSYYPAIQVQYSKIVTAINLTADKIVKGNIILGVEGTGETNIPFEDEPEYAECLELTNTILGIGDDK